MGALLLSTGHYVQVQGLAFFSLHELHLLRFGSFISAYGDLSESQFYDLIYSLSLLQVIFRLDQHVPALSP